MASTSANIKINTTPTNSPLPHLLLLGSTGRIGRFLTIQALSHGYTITTLARDPTSLAPLSNSNPNLTVIKGTPTSSSDLLSALQQSLSTSPQSQQITILSTLGQTRASGNPFSKPTSPPLFMASSITSLLTAIQKLPPSSRSRVQKLIVLSMFGAGSSFSNLHFAVKPIMRYSSMDRTVEDHNAVDQLVRGQDRVRWVMVRPSMLKEGEKKEVVVRDDEGTGEGWMPSSTTMGTVVDFLLGCVGSGEWDGRSPVIVN